MRLKSLKLAGFKSFANPTTFSFRHGITAIVGPNGCGKSNVIDAIRWVLGETSAKQLRGGAMSDVIFAGTQDKAAKSVASVELIFEHTQDEAHGIRHELNLYHELAIKRQINLDGRSDYFINGTRARRRDVIDVFLGTGLGARSYAVIEQGMIGRIVDSSPLQLREFIEEAAGVSRYQARREETQKQLVIAQENLARLSDLQIELSRQQKSLAKQAASAERYQDLTLQIDAVKEKLAIQDWYHAKHHQHENKLALDAVSKQVMALQSEIDTLKAKQDLLDDKISQESWLKDRAQDKYHDLKLRHQQSNQALQALKDSEQQSRHQLARADEQYQQASRDIEQLEITYQEHSDRLAELTPKFAAISETRRDQDAKLSPLTDKLTAAQSLLNQTLSRHQKLNQDQALNKQALSQLETARQKWQQQNEAWQTLWNNSAIDNDLKSPLAEQIETLNQQLCRHQEQKLALTEQKVLLTDEQRALRQTLKAEEANLKNLETKSAKLSGEYDTLHRLLHQKTVKTEARLIASSTPTVVSSQNAAALSSFREQIKLTELGKSQSAVLDYWLMLFLDSQILPKTGAAKASDNTSLAQSLQPYLADILQYQVNNDPKLNHSLWLWTDNEDSFAENIPEPLISLDSLIAAPKLRLWQNCYLCLEPMAEIDAAQWSEMLSTLPKSALILTQEGWLVGSFGTVQLNCFTRDKLDAENQQFLTQRLAKETRLNELDDELNLIDRQIEDIQAVIKSHQREDSRLVISIEELAGQLSQLQLTDQNIRQQHNQSQLELRQHQLNLERLQQDKARLEAEERENERLAESLLAKQETISAQLAKSDIEIDRANADIDAKQSQIEQITTAQKVNDDEYQSLQLAIQKSEIERRHHEDALQKRQKDLTKSAQYQAQLRQKLANIEQKLPSLEREVTELALTLDEELQALTDYQSKLSALKIEHGQIKAELDQLQQQHQVKQEAQSLAASSLAVSEERLLDASRRVEALDLAVSIASLTSDFITHQRRPKPEQIAALNHELEALTGKLTNIGAVNLAAAAELADINARLEPLTAQIEDIDSSISMLNQAIKTIDDTTKTLFLQTLDAVNAELAGLFAKVFGGGQASLTLNFDELPADTPKREAWRAGLTLMAQPKGKRNSRLAVLSGGEKTLTALSLIFAIFKQHPAPFCVLDEVDAPLDDANVARFTNLIEELAGEVQFIFISHNKLAMQIADELKGVTMPQAGISTQVSVQLSDAEHYLESQ